MAIATFEELRAARQPKTAIPSFEEIRRRRPASSPEAETLRAPIAKQNRLADLVEAPVSADSVPKQSRFSDLVNKPVEPSPQAYDPNEPPAMARPQAQPQTQYPSTLLERISEIKSRIPMQLWNKLVAEPAHAMSDTTEDNLSIAIAESLKNRIAKYKAEIPPPSLSSPAKRIAYNRALEKYVESNRQDIKNQLVNLPPEAREDDELKKYPQFAPKKPALGVEVPAAQNKIEKAADIGTGVASFIAKVALLKKAMPGLSEPMAWELTNEMEGGKPAAGLGRYAIFGGSGELGKAIASKIPGGTALGKAGKVVAEVAPQSVSMFGMAKIAGETTEDAIMQALIPVAYKALNIAVNEGPEYVRGKLEQRAVTILRNKAGKVIDLSKVPDESLRVIVQAAKEGKQLRSDYAKGKITPEQFNQAAADLNNRLQLIFQAIAKQQPVKPTTRQPQQKTTTPATTTRPQTMTAAISEKPPYEAPARVKTIVGPPIAPKPTPETQPAFDTSKVPIVEVPVWKVKLSRDVPNFKKAASPTTGIIEGEELSGKYERLATAPILVWERNNSDMEVITGRHRLDLARRTGEKTIPAQIVKESEGFTKAMALTIDAESNIREGQGGVKDYAQYFRNSPEITEESARERGLLSRAKGEAGFRIGKGAVDDVYAAFNAGYLTDTKAAAIARGAPNNESAQLAAMSKADKMSPEELEQFARILSRSTPTDKLKPTQGNLFGYDESAFMEAEAVAKEVSKEVRSIKDRILAVKGALQRPETARKMGLEFSDEASIRREVERLTQRLDDLARVSTTPGLWQEMKQRAGLPVETEPQKPKGIFGQQISPPLTKGETTEFLNKEDYRLAEPDIEGQQRIPIEPEAGPQGGGRETGATTLIPDMLTEGIALGRRLINHPVETISSFGRLMWRSVRRGRNVINTLGGAGKLLAKDLDEITFRVTKNVNNDRLDLKKAYAGLTAEQRQTVAKIINERILPLTQLPKLVAKANQVRDILDRSMKAGAGLEMTRKVRGKQIPLAGSGKAYPQAPNKAGIEFLNEAEAKGLGSAKVFAWAQEQVKAGNYENIDQAVDGLRRFRELHIRGLNPYLEAERVELPDEYIEWDGANILPHLIERNWMTVEGVRQWGKDFGRVYSRLEQIRSKYGAKAAKRVETFIATSFGKMSPASTEAQTISNNLRAYQYATKVGLSPLTIWRNMADRFAKMLTMSQNPRVVATALKEYPPFANAFMDSARKLEEKATRAGAVFGHGAIAEGYEPGNMLSEIVGKPFSESEKGNQVFIALVRYHQLLKDIDTWQKRKGADSVTTRLANRLGIALQDPTKYRLQEHGSKVLDALEKGEPITDDMLNEALHYTVRDRAFPVVLSTKPMWWETQPLIKIFTQFKTWPKEQLGMMWNDVVKYTVKTGDPRRLFGFIVGTIIAGELYNIARDYLYEKDESITSQFFKEDKHWAKAIVNDLLDGGIVGILADFTYGIYDWAFGPSVTTGRNIRNTIATAYKRPSLTIPAITRLIQQEVTPVRQVIKTWDKIDRRFINRRNITKDYFRVRDWAWQYKEGYLKPDMLDKIQGVADDLIYGKVHYKPGDNTLAYQMAARQIMVGDIEDAKAYFKNIIEPESKELTELPEKEKQEGRLKVISTIERTMKAHYSPYGHILNEKEADFLKQLPEKERLIAQSVQRQWQRNMAEALYSLIPDKDLQNLINKNISLDIDKPETYGRPHKGKEEQVEQWRTEQRRRK